MRKVLNVLLFAAVVNLTISCTKKSVSQPKPISTMNFTMYGRTYSHSSAGLLDMSVTSSLSAENYGYGISNSLPQTVASFQLDAADSNITLSIQGIKADRSTAVGVYRVGRYPLPALASLTVDYGNVSIYGYRLGTYVGADTTSTLTVTLATEHEVAGTFDLRIFSNGFYNHATGNFDNKF